MLRRLSIHLNNSPDCAVRIKAAIALARQHEATLIGIYTDPALPGYITAGSSLMGGVQEVVRRQLADARKLVKAAFTEAIESAGIAWSWQTCEGPAAAVTAWLARMTDMLVIGQESAESRQIDGSGFIEEVLLSTGRPVLAIPSIGAPPVIGDNVLYCWDRGRESARALADAAPLLSQASALTALTMDPSSYRIQRVGVPFEELQAYCAAHGFPPVRRMARDTAGIDMGEIVLSLVADLGADLIVMGAYGRSRLNEWIMGGATGTLLKSMTVPVLFSH